MSDMAGSNDRSVKAPRNPLRDVLDLVATGSLLISVARPASKLRSAVVSASNRDFRLMTRAPEGLEERVSFCSVHPIAVLESANAGSKSVVGPRSRRIAYQSSTQGPIPERLSIVDVETIGSIFEGLRRCSLLEIGDCADTVGVAKSATPLLALAPLVVFDLGHLDVDRRSATIFELRALSNLKDFVFFDASGRRLIGDDVQIAERSEIFLAMRDYEWSFHLSKVPGGFGADIDLAAQAADARRELADGLSAREGESDSHWSTRIEAQWLGATGFYAIEGSYGRPYRFTGPQHAAPIVTWLPNPGSYRFSFQILDWPHHRDINVANLLLNGEALATTTRRDGEDLVVEAVGRLPPGDLTAPQLLTLVTKPAGFSNVDGFRKGLRVHALSIHEIL